MNFTAKDVADLRAKTGCGMMDCKKALTEAEGDVEKATEILREKGLAASVKKASRIAAEGVAYAMVSECGKVGVVIEVNAETDFVAKNAQFIDFVKTCAETVICENPADVEALLAAKAHGSDMTVDAMLKDKILTIGENIKIRRFVRYEGDCVAYVHGGGRIGVLVRFETENVPAEVLNECGKDVAMQIAALNPAYLDFNCSSRMWIGRTDTISSFTNISNVLRHFLHSTSESLCALFSINAPHTEQCTCHLIAPDPI